LNGVGLKAEQGHGGAVTLIQRLGSAANLDVHLHCLVPDGVYRSGSDGAAEFVEMPAPSEVQVRSVLHNLIIRLMKLLTRREVLVEEMGQTYLAEPDADGDEVRSLRPLQAAAVTYRIAFGPRAGHKVLTLRGAIPSESPQRQPLFADIDGFSLHAAVRVRIDSAWSRFRCAGLRPSLTRRGESNDSWNRAIGHQVVGIPLKSAQSARHRRCGVTKRLGERANGVRFPVV